MSDDYDGPTQFIPDGEEFDYDPAEEVDLDAMMEMEQQRQTANDYEQASTAGQGTPRKLDFASYGLGGGEEKGHTKRWSQNNEGTPASNSLALQLDEDDTPMPAARSAKPPVGLSHFEREREAEEKRSASARPLASTVSSGVHPSVLPPLHRSVSDLRAQVMSDDERIYVYRRAPTVGASLANTNAKGERVFLPMESASQSAARLAAHNAMHRSQQMHRQLGQMNVRALLKQLDEEATAAGLVASQALHAARELESDSDDDERVRLTKRRKRKECLVKKLDAKDLQAKMSAKNKQLWVDKYAPRAYGDLLSPEQINREVLEWLKGWDTCVFGERKSLEQQAHARTLDSAILTNRVLSPTRKSKKPSASLTKKVDGEEAEVDIRPEQKVILLCGPPGLGKTTLAHILAKQAGYHPFEINASDDRNAAVLEAKIRAATEMQAVSFGAAHQAKPNCVIVDEIDGIGDAGEMGAIAMLLRIVQAEAVKKSEKGTKGKGKAKASEANDANEEGDSGSEDEAADESKASDDKPSKKGSKSKRSSTNANGDALAKASPLKPLRRPIICICNDQFAAALRPLRQVARIFEFTAAPKTKFVDRLKYIAGREQMQFDPRTLGALADVVEMDIRSALNTLQFVHSRGQKLTADALNSLAIGRKDTEKSRFQVWDAVFCDRAVKKDQILKTFRDMRETEEHNNHKQISTTGGARAGGGSSSALLSAHDVKSRELLALLSDAGDMDKILEGIHHNYPSVGYSDPSFSKTVACADWLAYADLLDQRISSEVEMGLMAYTPYAAIGIHHLTARPRKVVLEAPWIGYQVFLEHTRNENIVKSFLSPMNRLTQHGVTISATVLDVLPFVLDILHPAIRAVNFAMLTQKEKGELSQLIDTMLSLAISYRPEVQSAFGATSSAAVTWNSRPTEGANVLYKLDPPIDHLAHWSNPLDAASADKFRPKDRFGNVWQKGGKGKFGQQQAQQQPAAGVSSISAFSIDKRDQNMPGKVKQMVLRELEFEAMRRNEAKRIEQQQEQQANEKQKAGNGDVASSPSLISPAVQKILDEEKRKRDRATAGAAAASATSPGAPTLVKVDEDESPASKRAKHSASLNFLNAHADHMKNRQRNRGRPAGAKLQLAGMKTEKEGKQTIGTHAGQVDANGDVDMAAAGSAAAEPTQPHGASVLSRFTHPLHFKFNEGCTNAVRRTVNVAHFLPL